MKKRLLKPVSLFMAAILVSGTFAGCGGNSKSSKASDSGISTPESTSQGPAAEIKIPVYERGNQGEPPADNNFWTKWVQEKALKDINVKVSYVPIPRFQDVDKFNMLIAAGEAPDIIYSYDYPVIAAFFGRGAFQEIPQASLDKYGTNLKKWIPEESLKYGKVNGKQYFITARRPATYNWVNLIRTDWLEKVGMKIPANNEEFTAALRAFKQKDPSGFGSKNIFPMAFSLQAARTKHANYTWRPENLSEEDLAMYSDVVIPGLSWEPEKEHLKWLNMLFNEELINPEWALDKDGKKNEAAFMNGKTGTFGMYVAKDPPIIQTLMKNVPTAKVDVFDAGALNAKSKNTQRGIWPFGMLSGINKSSKNVDAVIKFLDWMSKPENLDPLQIGIEGKNYKSKDKDGNPIPDPTFKGEERLLNGTNMDIWCLVTAARDLGDDKKNVKADSLMRSPDGFEYLMSHQYDLQNTIKMVPDFLFDKPVTSLTKNQKTLEQKWDEALVKLIMCKPSEFDGIYTTLAKDYLSNGYQEILDEKKKIYNEMKSKK